MDKFIAIFGMVSTTTGQVLARGVSRYLSTRNYVSVTEFIPTRGLRVDVLGLGPKSEIWVIECKTSIIDYQTDKKWKQYLDWCDFYFWAVDCDFPVGLLPENTGLMIADAYSAEIVRMPQVVPLSPARRRVLI